MSGMHKNEQRNYQPSAIRQLKSNKVVIYANIVVGLEQLQKDESGPVNSKYSDFLTNG